MHQSVKVQAIRHSGFAGADGLPMPIFSEDIRLVIWDLDETFWDGTLTEGGITYRQDHHELVIDLAQRGIMSSICSKNAFDEVKARLCQTGLWDFFVFPSIDWSPKGPRIKAMLTEIGLRAQSVLFVDDNPMNLAQAAEMNPGLNVALPDLICTLSDAAQLHGKPDPELIRLSQYKVKERKRCAQETENGDTRAFLRQSNIQVFIDYDVEAHLDRAVELINRTNQLNFTKSRLPEDPVLARDALLSLLSLNTMDAGLIRVRDDFGDYGFVGLYVTRRHNNARKLVHFCFSCRMLNMYIEHWLYDFLGRPKLDIAEDVLSNPVEDEVDVNWVTPALIDAMEGPVPVLQFERIIARGGCDLASLMHYFSLHSQEITEEFNHPKAGQMLRRDHTSFLMPAFEPLSKAQLNAAGRLGYAPPDFETALSAPENRNTLCFLSFWADVDVPLYRHKISGLCLPYWLVGAQHHDLIARSDLRDAVARTDLQRERLKVLAEEFEHVGMLTADQMLARYGMILDHLSEVAAIVVILANERGPLCFQDSAASPHHRHVEHNDVIRSLARSRPNVVLIDPADHIRGADDLIDLNHFKRPVYHRMYRDVLERLTKLTVCADV